MKIEVNGQQFTCDGCGKIELVNPADGPTQPFKWFVGDVFQEDATGGFGGEWHACKLGCVTPAVSKAVGLAPKTTRS